MANVPILSFSGGEASPQIDARSDVEKYRSLCRHLENFIPTIYGAVVRRPGTYYINSAYGGAQTVRLIPFTYSSTITYELEFGNLYIRAFYADTVIVTITTPYLAEDLFQLQYKQVGDTMWITHPDYAPRKLTRTSATEFSLDVIKFKKGPFFLRNDLIDVDVTDITAFMLYTPDTGQGTDVGDTGTLTGQDRDGNAIDFFQAGHAPLDVAVTTDDGALFKLINNRWNKVSKGKLTGTKTGILCKAIDVKGSFRWTTHGTWTALVELQKNENDSDWETVESYDGEKDINVPTATKIEEDDNVQYRVNVSDEEGKRTSSTIKSSITALNDIVEGVVRVTEYVSQSVANVVIIARMESTTIKAITKATQGVITTNGEHNLSKGDKIQISQVAGMTAINGAQTVLKVLTHVSDGVGGYDGKFSIDLNTSGYTAYTSGGIITPPPTRRWAEGAWSIYRGYPSSVTFLDDRCIYGGQVDILEQVISISE